MIDNDTLPVGRGMATVALERSDDMIHALTRCDNTIVAARARTERLRVVDFRVRLAPRRHARSGAEMAVFT